MLELSRLSISSTGLSNAGAISGNSGASSTTGSTVSATANALVPLSAVTKLASSTEALSVNHLGQLPSVTISFNLSPGVALSDAVQEISQAQQKLNTPATVTASFQGTAQAFQSSLSNMGVLLFIAIVTVYIILGIL